MKNLDYKNTFLKIYSLYKGYIYYTNEELNIHIKGCIDSRDKLSGVEDLERLSELTDFEFIDKTDLKL